MAIPYIAARIVRLTETSGPCAIIAYLGRTTVRAQRTGIRHDYRRLTGDVVYEDVWLPEEAPARLAGPAALANAMEAAERVRTWDDRQRLPQPAWSLIIALPPDREVSLDEAIEIVDRIVAEIRGEYRLAAYVAIHEPRLRKRTALSPNRHAHVILPLRELTPDGFATTKLRELFARVRTMSDTIRERASVKRPYYVAEGVSWPDLAWSVQNRYFLEIGSELRVQPIAAVPQDHWPALMWSTEPEAVDKYLRDLHKQNRAFALDDGLELVTVLMRGRSTLLLEDLRAFLERCIDDPATRRDRINAILAHPEIVECVPSRQGAKADRITTREIHRLLTDAIAVVDRCVKNQSERLQAVRGSTSQEVINAIQDALKKWGVDRSNTDNEGTEGTDVVLIGESLSHIDGDRWIPVTGLTEGKPTPVQKLKGPPEEWKLAQLVVLPRAEMVSDIDLARILLEVDRRGVGLLLGVDEGHADGVVDHRLAVEIATRLTATDREEQAQLLVTGSVTHLRRAEELLRAGFVAPAVKIMEDAGLLRFRREPPTAEFERTVPRSDAVLVIDDPRLRRTVNDALHEAAIRGDTGEQFASGLGPSMSFAVGEPVVISKTDYGEVPPRLREGTIAQVVMNSEPRELILKYRNGGETTIRGDACAHLRPAYALSIREARTLVACRIPTAIEVTRVSSAWAALLLACRMNGNAVVMISPAVAASSSELASAVELAFPSALPSSFEIRPNPEAPVAKEFNDLMEKLTSPLLSTPSQARAQTGRSSSLAIRDQPTPARSATTKPSNIVLPVAVRDLISKDLAGEGFVLLCAGLADPKRVKSLLARIDAQGSPGLQALAHKLVPVATKAGAQPTFNADKDLPRSLECLAPIELSDWELHRLKSELASMTLKASGWGLREPLPSSSRGSSKVQPLFHGSRTR
jgi:hypothetical protein